MEWRRDRLKADEIHSRKTPLTHSASTTRTNERSSSQPRGEVVSEVRTTKAVATDNGDDGDK